MEGDEAQQTPLLAQTDRRDPYSLQLSFVLPDWPDRLKGPEFRRFAERTILAETPAHLTATIHWVDAPTMQTFVDSYADWLEKRRSFITERLGG
jgi:hypothetical protein